MSRSFPTSQLCSIMIWNVTLGCVFNGCNRCAGFNNVDVDAASELGIRVARVPTYSPESIAEHAVAMLLSLARSLHQAHIRTHLDNFSLSGLVGFEIHGKTVGVMGTGNIGLAAIRIFKGFGTRCVCGCDLTCLIKQLNSYKKFVTMMAILNIPEQLGNI